MYVRDVSERQKKNKQDHLSLNKKNAQLKDRIAKEVNDKYHVERNTEVTHQKT